MASSNDGATWSTIHTGSRSTTWNASGLYIDVSTTNAFDRYALVITNIRTDAAGLVPAIANLQLYANPRFHTTTIIPVNRMSSNALPVGSVIPFAASNAPSGFLACDGTIYSRATYPALYQALSNTYGGDATSFGVPDLRGRVPYGSNAADANNAGTRSLTLTNDVLPSHGHTWSATGPHSHDFVIDNHTHSVNIPAHSHSIWYDASRTIDSGSAATYRDGSTVPSSFNVTVDATNVQGTFGNSTDLYWSSNQVVGDITCSNTGSTTPSAFSIEQPFIAMQYIIKF